MILEHDRKTLLRKTRQLKATVGIAGETALVMDDRGLRLAGTNHQIFTTISLDDGSPVASAGTIGFNVRHLIAAVNAQPEGRVTIDGTDDRTVVGPNRILLPECITVEGLKKIPSPSASVDTIEKGEFRQQIAGVLRTKDKNHPIFGGIRIESVEGKMRLTSTDTFRLFHQETPFDWSEEPFTVMGGELKKAVNAIKAPRFALQLLAGDVLQLNDDAVTVLIPTDQSRYPDYRRWSPQIVKQTRYRFDSSFAAWLKTKTHPKSPTPVLLTLNEVGFTAVFDNDRKTAPALTSDGIAEHKYRMNSQFLLDALLSLNTEDIDVRLPENDLRLAPMRFDSAADNSYALIMPMRDF